MRERIDRYMAAYNVGDLDALGALVTPGYVHHNNADALSLDGFKGGARWIRRAMPDFRIDLLDAVEGADRLAVRWRGQGTQATSMFGEAVTGRSVVLNGITIYRFEGELIAEDWEAMDEADLRRQVGALAD
jgi:predicted ester cyclase